MSNTTKGIKLSKKMVEIIKAMQEKECVFGWRGVPTCKFHFKGKTVRYDVGSKLAYQSGLVIRSGKEYVRDYYYTLTELGKSIEL